MAPQVREVPERSRFEATVDGELAGYAEYVRTEQVLDFTHTKVDERFEGQGVGSALIGYALDAVRDRGEQAIPHCPFVKKYMERHPEYVALVPESRRAAFGLDSRSDADQDG